jgi:peptidoglycan/xylan/chitin deacetylase (PgdA/CDA1 family)
MKTLRHSIIRAGLEVMYFSGAHLLLQPIYGGAGIIFMLHHVRPASAARFQPNRHLEISPDFLRTVLAHVRALGLEIVTLDEMHRRLQQRDFSKRFACFTCDDGYRDNRDHALPAMREFDAPMAVYVTSDFAAGTGRLWWVALERVIAGADAIDVKINGQPGRLETQTPEAKDAAFARLHGWLRTMSSEDDVRAAISDLCHRYGVDEAAISSELCMSWPELRDFAADPLVTIGAHTLSHCNLAKAPIETATRELSQNRADIEAAIGRPVRHLAYPYGDSAAATPREFALARSVGFSTAVTTRPGMIFADSADHMIALPRLSLNGNYQQERLLSVLTSGAATALWNGFRRGHAA